MHVVFLYMDVLPQPCLDPFCNGTASWNADLDVCSNRLFLKVMGTQAIVWLGRRQILLSRGFLWICKRIWHIYCALLPFVSSHVDSCKWHRTKPDIQRPLESCFFSAWFLSDDKFSSYTKHPNFGMLERRRTSGSVLLASAENLYMRNGNSAFTGAYRF